MKHSELKVGMKVKRKPEYIQNYSDSDYIAVTGEAVTVSEIIHGGNGDFYIEEVPHMSWNAEYFDKVEDVVDNAKKEKLKMNKISLDKKYKTRDGKPVRVLCVDAKLENSEVIALVSTDKYSESAYHYTSTGRYFCSGDEHYLDLIEVSPYEDFKVDDKVMVSTDGSLWQKSYFSHIDDNGCPCVFCYGKTSWTGSETTPYRYCKKFEG